MFEGINSTINIRFSELRQTLLFIKNNEPSALDPGRNIEFAKTQKGLFFVHLYGIYEWTIHSTIVEAISQINSSSIPLNLVKPIFYSVALHSSCDSLHNVGNSKKWERRWNLFNQISTSDYVNIPSDIMPTDGGNFKVKQLRSICSSFAIHKDLFERMSDIGIIDELVEKRNEIAHGNSSPSDVGSRFTFSDLEIRFHTMQRNCIYFVSVFEEYLINKYYLS